MSTHDYNLANQSGASFRSDLNNALSAILSNNSNASSPSTTAAYMLWADTNAGILKIRNSANDGWVKLINLDGTIARDISLTGDLTLTDKIIHSGDTNTAIRFPANDTFTVETSGSERFRLDSDGRLGVGLTPHTSDVATSVTEGLIQTDGNIDIRYAGTNSDPAGARYLNFINTDTSLVAGQPMGGIHWIGNDTSNPDTITCSITADITGNSGIASHMLFKTSGTQRMSIYGTGEMIVGTGDGSFGPLDHGDTLSVGNGSGDLAHFLRSGTGNSRVLTVQSGRATGTTSGTMVSFENASGSVVGDIISDNSSTAYNTSSDYRLKENVVPISDGITRLKTLKPSRFNWIVDETNTLIDGFLAHEVTAVPEAVTGTKDAVITQEMIDKDEAPTGEIGDAIYQGIDQSKLVPLLTAALQEAITKIETLETKVAALEAG